jgi:tetratricopeptide (TPR) repeat protein
MRGLSSGRFGLSDTLPFEIPPRLLILFALVVAIFWGGCSRDPKIQKQKFLKEGNLAFEQGKYPEASILYGKSLQEDPRFAEAHYRLALTQMKLGTWSYAAVELSRAIELKPDLWEAQLELGKLQLAGGKPQDAKDRALLILRGNPTRADAQLLLANSDWALGNRDAALREAAAAIPMAPESSSVYLSLGQLQARSGLFADAETNLKRAQLFDTRSATPPMTLGFLYQQQKRWSEAETQFQAAVQLAPKDPAPRAALADLYFAQGQIAEGEAVLTKAKEDLPDVPAAYRLLGDSYLVRGNSQKAIEEFGSLSGKYPNDIGVQKTYLQLLLQNHRLEEAAQLSDAIAHKAPQDTDTLVLRGQLLLQQGKTDEAIATFQSALKLVPGNALGHFYLGEAFREKANLSQAETEWREAVRLRPGFLEAWIALAAAATQRSDWHGLEDIGNRLVKLAPNYAEGYLAQATAKANLSDPKGAEADLLSLQQLAPQSPVSYLKLADLRMNQKRLPEADSLFRQALARDPDSLEAVRGLVQIAIQQNRAADALRLTEQQISRSPNSPGLYFLQARLFQQLKQPDRAEVAAGKAVELEGKNELYLAYLAELQADGGKREQAIASFQRAIEVSPNDPRLYLAIGGVYEAVGNWAQAQSSYEKCLTLQEDNSVAANNLAYLLLEHGGNVNVALSLAQTARKGLPNSAHAADTLGWAYFRNSAYSVAIPLLEEAVRQEPRNQGYRYHLALAYQQLNDADRAKVEFERIINLDPKSPVANEAREGLTQIPK